jgi:hypothetical protein
MLVVEQGSGPALPVQQDPFDVLPSGFRVAARTLLGDGNGRITRAEFHLDQRADPGSLEGSAGYFELHYADPDDPSAPPLSIAGDSLVEQVVTDLGFPASKLIVTFASGIPTTGLAGVNLNVLSGASVITSAETGQPLDTASAAAASLIDGAPPIVISTTLLDTDANGSADMLEFTFSEEVWFSTGRGASLGGPLKGDPDVLTIPAPSSLRVVLDGPVGPGPIDRVVTVVDPDDPDLPAVQGAERIARAIEKAVRAADPSPRLAHFTTRFDGTTRRYILRSGVAGTDETIQIQPSGLPDDAAPALRLGGANGGVEAAGRSPGLPDLADFVVLSADGKSNLLEPTSSVQVLGNVILVTLGQEIPETETPEFLLFGDVDGGGVADRADLLHAAPLRSSANAPRFPTPIGGDFIRVAGGGPGEGDVVLDTAPGRLTLDASPSFFPLTGADPAAIAGFRWVQVSGPRTLSLTDPDGLVTETEIVEAGTYEIEAVAQVQPPGSGVLNPYVDGDGTVRRLVRVVAACSRDLHCDDGDPCNGAEVCLADGTCGAAPPVGDICDGIDNDCDGVTDEGQVEICNGIDDDCDGLGPAEEADADADGVRICEGDCDDANPDVRGAPRPVTGLVVEEVSPGTYRFTWDSQADLGPAIRYDGHHGVMTPSISFPEAIRAGGCVAESLSSPEFVTSGPFAAGVGEFDFWMFRATNSCGTAGYGTTLRDTEAASSGAACTLGDGAPCDGGGSCSSSICTDEGVCCASSCDGPCRTCAGGAGGPRGACGNHAAGTDPENGCNGFTCDGGGECRTSCADDAECAPGFFCEGSICQPKRDVGEPCARDSQCRRPGSTDPVADGFCSDGFCCDVACDGNCVSCHHPGLEGTCSPDPPGSGPAESCDGVDNDCDGLTDEDFAVSGSCAGLGVCGTGVTECAGPSGLRCSTMPGGSADASSPEVCDGTDNDCDGETDEALVTSCGVGACAATGTCVDGADTCAPLPPAGPEACGDGIDNDCDGFADLADGDCQTAEFCDGLDNDGDGDVDEGFGVGAPCLGSGGCGEGVLECAGPLSTRCSTDPGASADGSSLERCDGLDNDCDGRIDEICPCTPGDVQTCSLGLGRCPGGTQTCGPLGTWEECSGAAVPALELCDGADNDCDGVTDEGFDLGASCVGSERVGGGRLLGDCGGGVIECDGAGGTRCSTAPGGSQDRSAPEVCDGLDNDCDGVADEGCPCSAGATQPCGPDSGVCSRGTQTCSPEGSWGACEGGVEPAAEVCDGEDNDCDGLTDEELTISCGVGECRATGTCDSGAETCTPLSPSAEACDGLDNDCDGLTDEGFSIRVACLGTGSCGAGVLECAGPSSVRCSTDPGGSRDASSPETCDGLDNDCDGLIDEPDAGCGCAPGSTQECGAAGGECLRGTQTCGSDGSWGPCLGAAEPRLERCDGLDNDCDGRTDEDFGTGAPCHGGGACGTGVVECAGPFVTRCSTSPGGTVDASRTESRNGLDDDCDGEVDESWACAPGAAEVCGVKEGICRFGSRMCGPTGTWGPCSTPGPDPEICDGLDDDCDGATDEGFDVGTPCAAEGACGGGVFECDGAGGARCSTGPGGSEDRSQPETCDGVDNDCDGFVDEGCPCEPGESQTCGSSTGTCVSGTQTCESENMWDACVGEVRPIPEACDGLDNDCDAATDEDLGTTHCGVGACAATGTCSDGTDTCVPLEPTLEACDGVDNDCDGEIDEDFRVGARCDGAGVCGAGVLECAGPSAVRCSTEPGGSRDESRVEVCDGLDNDCDGLVDEGCPCQPGTDQTCGVTGGVCGGGSQTCDATGVWGPCSAAGPAPEICDGLDNDCDGQTDEDFGVGTGCTAPGSCGTGIRECADLLATRCSTAPGGSMDGSSPEVCDGIDNDCDGAVDEPDAGCSCAPGSEQACGGPATGECSPGTQTCSPTLGGWGVCDAIDPRPEVCDGLDNDCDASTDEQLEPAVCGVGECRAATTCGVGGSPECTPGAPVAETCDGLDNDCDGFTDEEFGSGSPCDGAGECGAGIRECAGPESSRCSTEPGGSRDQSAPETCDGLDNDCDGATDEGAFCHPLGASCGEGADCASGSCADGFCCDTTCPEPCRSCGLAGSEGTCSPEPAGTADPACSGHLCDGAGACTTSCASDADCAAGYRCDPGPARCVSLDLYGTTVGADGSVLEPAGRPLVVVAHDQDEPVAVFDGNALTIYWTDAREGTPGRIFRGRDPRELAAGGVRVAAPAPGGQSQPRGTVELPGAGSVESHVVVVWSDTRYGTPDILGTRVDASGTILDPEGLSISAAPGTQMEPDADLIELADEQARLALLTWTHDRGDAIPLIMGSRWRVDTGTVLDPSGFPISGGEGKARHSAAASDGTNFIVVWTDTRSGNPDVYAARVSPSGAVLDPNGIALSAGPHEESQPAVAFDGTNFFVAWTDGRSGDPDIFGSRVSPTGEVLDPAGVPIAQAPLEQHAPRLVFAGGAGEAGLYLVAWEDGRLGGGDLFGARVDPGGTVLDPVGIPICTEPGMQRAPSLATDGFSFSVVWVDDRPPPSKTR